MAQRYIDTVRGLAYAFFDNGKWAMCPFSLSKGVDKAIMDLEALAEDRGYKRIPQFPVYLEGDIPLTEYLEKGLDETTKQNKTNIKDF